MTKGRSENKNGIPYTYEIFHARSIPVCQANAAVTGCAADGFGIVRAVNSDAGLVQSHPKDANEIVRTRWQVVMVLGAHAVLEHPFIVAEPRPDIGTAHLPAAPRRRQRFRPRGN